MPGKDPLILEQRLLVNKRLTMNMFIQGAATEAFIKAHRSVETEIETIEPELLPLYDKMMVSMHLGYWVGSLPLIMGNPVKYFRRLERPGNPFRYHRFMLQHGEKIASEARDQVFAEAEQMGLATIGWKNEWAQLQFVCKALELEAPHQLELETIAKNLCVDMYGIDFQLLNGELTTEPEVGEVRTPQSWSGKLIKRCMIGWSNVQRNDGQLQVFAKAWMWPFLLHELVKGTVELICLHGMTSLLDEEFELVMDETEHVEYEIPMLQIGGAFYRRFQAVIPAEIPIAESLMHVAQMPALILDEFLDEMMTSPNRATDRLRSISRKFQ
ncbi:MAG: hypothetical protein AAF939_19295 [Planctomycetota bacterium]